MFEHLGLQLSSNNCRRQHLRPSLNVCYINSKVKKLQSIDVFTATCIDWHSENSKNDKKRVILASITSPNRLCAAGAIWNHTQRDRSRGVVTPTPPRIPVRCNFLTLITCRQCIASVDLKVGHRGEPQRSLLVRYDIVDLWT